MRIALMSALVAAALSGTAALASVDVMIQPDDAVILSGGPGNGSIVNTYNQAGLSVGYISGVTPTSPYLSIASHTNLFACCEWFGESGTNSAVVSYHVTKPRNVWWIDSFELWNEESSGIGVFELWWGTSAGDLNTLLIAGGVPTDNPLGPDYFANVWKIAPTPGGWYTLIAGGCPQPDPGTFPSCAIGEVAFNGHIPEPASWAMMIAGFGLVGAAMRRRQTVVAA
jgi:PEP-CTERM motif